MTSTLLALHINHAKEKTQKSTSKTQTMLSRWQLEGRSDGPWSIVDINNINKQSYRPHHHSIGLAQEGKESLKNHWTYDDGSKLPKEGNLRRSPQQQVIKRDIAGIGEQFAHWWWKPRKTSSNFMYFIKTDSICKPLGNITLTPSIIYSRFKTRGNALLLRLLFQSIGGGKFEQLYKQIVPLLEMRLESLNNQDQHQGTRGPESSK